MFDRRLYVKTAFLLVVACGSGLTLGQAPSADCPLHDRGSAAEATSISPYAGKETQHIKALSQDERQQLLAGHGMGLALAAELNHYPGPKHVLELASKLDLTEEQMRRTREIFHDMQAEAQALGRQIVDAEAALDARFAGATIDEASLASGIRKIGSLQADLRLAHLRAHLRMKAALTPQQVQGYDALRGYCSRTASH